MASISERETGEIEAANASGDTPVVLIHAFGCSRAAGPAGLTSSNRRATRR